MSKSKDRIVVVDSWSEPIDGYHFHLGFIVREVSGGNNEILASSEILESMNAVINNINQRGNCFQKDGYSKYGELYDDTEDKELDKFASRDRFFCGNIYITERKREPVIQ